MLEANMHNFKIKAKKQNSGIIKVDLKISGLLSVEDYKHNFI